LPATSIGQHYQLTRLVSDTGDAAVTDPDLQNAWGIAFNPNGVVWIADNGTGKSTLYDGDGNKQSLIVTIPPASGSSPTGIVFNSSQDFAVTASGKTGPSAFIFATEAGTLAGWSPSVDSTHALQVVDNSSAGSIYKGLAMGGNGSGHFLYATDFHNGEIHVFDKAFTKVTSAGGFKDPRLPSGFAPFGIQNINGNLYVTYARQDADKKDDIHGPHLGYVNVFDPDGHLLRRLISRGQLNAPWGLALAPANFGRQSNRLLVGNFGDGAINAYDLATGAFLGTLRAANGRVLSTNGLWGLSFGNGVHNQPVGTLFITAGPDDEAHGLYAKIEPVP
jgi:uncharacterized protein (TIGR03118 family)